jgi:hypothetical protein
LTVVLPVDAERFLEGVRALPAGKLSREQLLTPEFRLHEDPGFSVYYAPFDYINRPAKLALVGITPGWRQMEIAFRTARACLRSGDDPNDALRAAKGQASFAGGMRRRMCGWLDDLALAESLGVASSEELFGPANHLLHATSAVRYPVIKSNGENWSGSGPSPTAAPVLRGFIHNVLANELGQVPDALIVPLGAAVSKALSDLVVAGQLDERRVLAGFPHPSGLNMRGPAVFRAGRNTMRAQVRGWFSHSAEPTARPRASVLDTTAVGRPRHGPRQPKGGPGASTANPGTDLDTGKGRVKTPLCPNCSSYMELKWVRSKRYWFCTDTSCAGDFPTNLLPPICLWCDREMELRLGDRGSWRERWFWSCALHRVPNAGLREQTGPADPGTLHRRKPRLGGGYYRHGI